MLLINYADEVLAGLLLVAMGIKVYVLMKRATIPWKIFLVSVCVVAMCNLHILGIYLSRPTFQLARQYANEEAGKYDPIIQRLLRGERISWDNFERISTPVELFPRRLAEAASRMKNKPPSRVVAAYGKLATVAPVEQDVQYETNFVFTVRN